jgi:hypothetical protein
MLSQVAVQQTTIGITQRLPYALLIIRLDRCAPGQRVGTMASTERPWRAIDPIEHVRSALPLVRRPRDAARLRAGGAAINAALRYHPRVVVFPFVAPVHAGVRRVMHLSTAVPMPSQRRLTA